MFVPPSGLPCNPIIKIVGTSTLAGIAVWLGKRIVPLSFQSGFLFSAISLISITIANKLDSRIEKKIKMPIIRNFIYFTVTLGTPVVLVHQITPLNLRRAIYLTSVAITTRGIFRILTDCNPFL